MNTTTNSFTSNPIDRDAQRVAADVSAFGGPGDAAVRRGPVARLAHAIVAVWRDVDLAETRLDEHNRPWAARGTDSRRGRLAH